MSRSKELEAGSSRSTSHALRESGVRPHRSRGQNFLQDSGFAARTVAFAGIRPGDSVLEIGPGTGVLTREIVRETTDLSVVEIEEGFAVDLPKRVPGLHPDRIFRRDIRDTAIPELFPTLFSDVSDFVDSDRIDGRAGQPPPRILVIGNVPYSISTDLLFWVFEQRRFIERVCFLMQHEFAARLAADPGSRAYGILSVYRALYARATLGETISGDNFIPPAKVDSTVLRLEMFQPNETLVVDEKVFQRIVRAAFSQRRKTLLNSFEGSGVFPDKNAVRELLHRVGVDGGRRAETLSLEEFVALADTARDFLK